MAKKKSDKERAIAFFTTAPEAEVLSVLEVVNTIAQARGFSIGRKRKSSTPATSTGTKSTRQRAQGASKEAGDAATKKGSETDQQSSAAAGS